MHPLTQWNEPRLVRGFFCPVAGREPDAAVGVAAAEIAVGQSNALIEGPAEERSEEDGLPQIDC